MENYNPPFFNLSLTSCVQNVQHWHFIFSLLYFIWSWYYYNCWWTLQDIWLILKNKNEHVGHCLRVAPVTDPVLSFYFSCQHGSLSSKLAIIGRAANSRTKRQPNPLLHAPCFECPLLLHDIPSNIIHITCWYSADHANRLPATQYPVTLFPKLHDGARAG